MTGLSSPTAVFLKESTGAYLSFPGESADTDTHTAQDFSWTLALSSSECNENQRPQQNTCFDVHWHLAHSLSVSLFVFLPHENQKTFLCSCFHVFASQFLRRIFESLTALCKRNVSFIIEHQNSSVRVLKDKRTGKANIYTPYLQKCSANKQQNS